MIDKVIGVVTGTVGKVRHDDDFVDRLNHRYTVIILVIFAIVATAQVYVGSAIACWAPAHFTGSHQKYVNSFCWVRNTYFLPLEDEIPKDGEDYKHEVIYYQWLPIIFLTQAVFFYLPRVIWINFNDKAGVDSDNIMDAAQSLNKAETLESKTRTLRLMTNQIDRFLAIKRTKNKGFYVSIQHLISSLFCCCGKRFGNYLVILYLFSKLLYIANIFGQLYILNSVLGHSYDIYGYELMKGLYTQDNWINNTVFPRVTMCDFKMRILGNVQRYTLQCVLPINLYVERMYAFFWFWLVVMALITVANFLTWCIRAMFSSDRVKYVQNHLRCADRINRETDRVMSLDFVDSYLRLDGVFIFQLMGHNTSNVLVNEVMGAVWDNWRARQNSLPRRRPSLPPKPKFSHDDDDSSIPLDPTAPYK